MWATFFFLRNGDDYHLQLECKVSCCNEIIRYWALWLVTLSVVFASLFHFFGLMLEFFLHKFNHDCEVFLQWVLVWVLWHPLPFISFPLFVNVGFPFIFVCQCLISLPVLKQLWLLLYLQDVNTRSCAGRQAVHIIMKPFSHMLCKSTLIVFHNKMTSPYLIIFFAFCLCS